jgi:hypothetical protein
MNLRVVPIIKHLSKVVENARKTIFAAVCEGATEIVTRYPFVDEYHQATGSATVTLTMSGKQFTISIKDDEPLYYMLQDPVFDEDPLDPHTFALLEKFESDCKLLQSLHNAWSDHLPGELADEPYRVTQRTAHRTRDVGHGYERPVARGSRFS